MGSAPTASMACRAPSPGNAYAGKGNAYVPFARYVDEELLFILMLIVVILHLNSFAFFSCLFYQGPGSAGYMPQTPYSDIPDTFDDISFQVIKATIESTLSVYCACWSRCALSFLDNRLVEIAYCSVESFTRYCQF